MTQTSRRSTAARGTPKQRQQRGRGLNRSGSRPWWQSPTLLSIAAFGIVAVALVAVVVLSRGGSNQPATNADVRNPVPASVLAAVTTADESTLEQIGSGGYSGNLERLTGSTTLRDAAGRPLIVYVGAEYCPYCAAERWALILALSRFGSFSGLQETLSSSTDVYPDTSTFTFVDASYTSSWVDFQPSEIEDRAQQPLQTPSTQAAQLFTSLDRPPYTSLLGAFPFLDIAGSYLLRDAGYSPQLLQGLSWTDIATDLSNPSDPVAKAIIGNANVLTAGICLASGNQPQSICAAPDITSIETSLDTLHPITG